MPENGLPNQSRRAWGSCSGASALFVGLVVLVSLGQDSIVLNRGEGEGRQDEGFADVHDVWNALNKGVLRCAVVSSPDFYSPCTAPRPAGPINTSLSFHGHQGASPAANSHELVELGVRHQTRGELDAAERCYLDAVKARATLPVAHFNLGTLQMAKGELRLAIETFSRVTTLQPRYATAWYNAGNAYFQLGEHAAAAEAFSTALRVDNNYAHAHANLATVLQLQGDLEGATRHYKEAIRIDPTFADGWMNYGNALKAEGRLDEAIKVRLLTPAPHRRCSCPLARLWQVEGYGVGAGVPGGNSSCAAARHRVLQSWRHSCCPRLRHSLSQCMFVAELAFLRVAVLAPLCSIKSIAAAYSSLSTQDSTRAR
jgi:Tfp pilus assembly protein PilF